MSELDNYGIHIRFRGRGPGNPHVVMLRSALRSIPGLHRREVVRMSEYLDSALAYERAVEGLVDLPHLCGCARALGYDGPVACICDPRYNVEESMGHGDGWVWSGETLPGSENRQVWEGWVHTHPDGTRWVHPEKDCPAA